MSRKSIIRLGCILVLGALLLHPPLLTMLSTAGKAGSRQWSYWAVLIGWGILIAALARHAYLERDEAHR